MIITFIRAFIIYVMVVIVMRMMGKRQIAQMQPFELVVTIMIADLAAVPMANTGIPLMNGVVPILTLLSVQVIISFLTLKSEKIREIMDGRPSVLIQKGKIVEAEVKRLRINMNDLLEELRGKDYYNLSDVEFAILETNGQISVIPKSNKRNLTTGDLKIQVPYEDLPITLIMDGNLNQENLAKSGFNKKWLLKQLKEQNINRIEDVFFAFLSSDRTFHAQKIENNNRKRGK
jgi:uncharacterized membrane protein YcaP (DUF421 family)